MQVFDVSTPPQKAFAKGTSTFCESSIGTEQLHARAIAFIDASPFAPPGGFGMLALIFHV